MKKKYTELRHEEVDYILVKTTANGPFEEDVFYLIFSDANNNSWQIPQSADEEFLDWLKLFPDINMEQLIKGMGCAEEGIFILYRGHNYPILSERKKTDLKNRLLTFLADNFEASLVLLTQISNDIFQGYQESSRHYHNLEHIQNCLWELDNLEKPGIDKKSIELAFWYHDVIYSPLSKTNELDSAKKMQEQLGKLKTKCNLENVYQMIISCPSAGHELTESAKYFIDIDFSILGQREFEYMAYMQNIRLEFHLVPKETFDNKRKEFLQSLLKRGIFLTQEFRTRYEERAINNITHELREIN
jgi:predicted metal-dependent HD superfamily phosphohydrolase